MIGTSIKMRLAGTALIAATALGLLTSVAALAGTVGPSPDTRDAAAAAQRTNQGLDPAIARAIRAHAQSVRLDGRSPDTIDAALQAHEPSPATDTVGPSPDTRDAAAAARGTLGQLAPARGAATGTSSAREYAGLKKRRFKAWSKPF